jgi:HD-GYP domain-containing protein (c-di-GMP phosphodiesterase class II)
VIEQHAVIGDKMLAPLELLAPVRPIVRNHHERWDGGGYPDRLAGEQIPLFARIVAVADSIEAMSAERPYRLPLREDEVVRELESGRDGQWDPTIADLALELISAGRLRFRQGGMSLMAD